MSEPNRNAIWATALTDELARQGVRDVFVGSGSRSGPLLLAFADDGRFRLHPAFDERSGAYCALGAGRASGRPAAVVTTSGTAAANVFPAVIEASLGESPLLVLTADRPGFLRGLDANQTVDQVRLFGPYVRAFHDVGLPRVRDLPLRQLRILAARAVAASLEPVPGPVHLNMQFDKPLERQEVAGDVPPGFATQARLAARGREGGRPFTEIAGVGGQQPAESVLDQLVEALEASRRGLIVAGPVGDPGAVGPAALRLSQATGFPLLADPLSGARFAPGAERCAVAAYDAWLGDREAAGRLEPDLLIRLGASPTSAAAQRFLEETEAWQVVVDRGARWKDSLGTAHRYLRADPAASCTALAARVSRAADRKWTEAWRALSAALGRALEEEIGRVFFEGAVASRLASGLPDGATLFVGNSLPIRDLDAFGRPRDGRLTVIGHRGASGIDGNVSSAVGAALAGLGPTVALLGDLAFLHDVNGLAAVRSAAIELTIVVANNDGGGIFEALPIRDYPEVFEPYVVMPHGLDLSKVAAAHGLRHRRADSGEALDRALDGVGSGGGPTMVEVAFDREASHRRRLEIGETLRRVGLREMQRRESPLRES